MNNNIYIAIVTLGLMVGTASVVAPSVLANDTNEGSKYPTVIQKIVDKFNLDQSQVDQVIDEQRNLRKTQRLEEIKTNLSELVSQNKLTQDQADKLFVKMQERQREWEGFRGNFENREQIREEMDAHREEMGKWLEENGIDRDILQGVMGNGRGNGKAKGGMMRNGYNSNN